MCACVRACVGVCVRACVHACVRACVRACSCQLVWYTLTWLKSISPYNVDKTRQCTGSCNVETYRDIVTYSSRFQMRFPIEPNCIMANLDASVPIFVFLTIFLKKDFINCQLWHVLFVLLHILPEPSTMKTKSTIPAHKKTHSYNQKDRHTRACYFDHVHITQLSIMVKCILRSTACSKSVCYNIYLSLIDQSKVID